MAEGQASFSERSALSAWWWPGPNLSDWQDEKKLHANPGGNIQVRVGGDFVENT